jgi:trans-AT polyketide synthase, acyltransferase and oxidoreductase domains
LPVLSYAPAIHPKNLGDPLFKQRHGLTYAYVAGAMANGITSVEMVQAASNAGMLGMFGAAGLSCFPG